MRTAVTVLLALASGTASGAPIHGEVYADLNRDGHPTAGEPGVAGVVVALDVTAFTRTDATGHFTLDLPDDVDTGSGVVWARVPDGYAPGPAWARYAGSDQPLEIGLRPTDEPGMQPLTFVVAADTHVHASQEQFGGIDLAALAREATALPDPPAFFTILGDITQGNNAAEFDIVDHALDGLGVPYVPVPGNHDWYDDGAMWKQRYGPDNYSFDIGDVHFVVWNMAMTDAEIRRYLGAELAFVDHRMTIVALTHAPPTAAVTAALRDLGVAYVLTGHTHSNRLVDHDGVIELNTEPLLMGGLDSTPAGYRVVTISGGKLSSYHRTAVDVPYLAITGPAPGTCAGTELIAAAELDAGPATVRARVDCGPPIAMRYAGGWSYRATLPPLGDGPHAIEVDATSWSGRHARVDTTVNRCATTGVVTSRPLSYPAPPLVPRWTVAVGGHVVTAAPAVGAGAAYVAVSDLGDGRGGGVVALDLATGRVRWRVATAVPIRAGPAVATLGPSAGGGTVVIAAQLDGAVRALDAATGAERWRVELGDGADDPQEAVQYAAPTVDGPDVLVGSKHRLAAIDVATGAVMWHVEPVPGAIESFSLAAVAVGGGVAVGAFHREFGGLFGYDRLTGALAWQLGDDLPIGINATPVIDGDAAIVANSLDEVFAVDLGSGAVRWRTALDPQGFGWGNATIGAPVVGHGIVVVPTLYDDAVALDTVSGVELWRYRSGPSPLRVTHYRGGGHAGFVASPALAGGIVWLAGTDGVISAVDLWTGKPLWRTPGPPVLAGLAIAGDALIAASYDGTVRALAPPSPGAVAAIPPDIAALAAPRCTADACAACTADANGPARPWLRIALAALAALLAAGAVAIGARALRRRS